MYSRAERSISFVSSWELCSVRQKAMGESNMPVPAALSWGISSSMMLVWLGGKEGNTVFGGQEHGARISIWRLVSSFGLCGGVGSNRSNVSFSIYHFSCGTVGKRFLLQAAAKICGDWLVSQVLVPHLPLDPHQPCFALGKQSKSEYSCKMPIYEAEIWVTTSFLIYHSLTNTFLKESLARNWVED